MKSVKEMKEMGYFCVKRPAMPDVGPGYNADKPERYAVCSKHGDVTPEYSTARAAWSAARSYIEKYHKD